MPKDLPPEPILPPRPLRLPSTGQPRIVPCLAGTLKPPARPGLDRLQEHHLRPTRSPEYPSEDIRRLCPDY